MAKEDEGSQDEQLANPQAVIRIIESIPCGWEWGYGTYREVYARVNDWYYEQDRLSPTAVHWVLANHFGRCPGESPLGEQPEDGMWQFLFLLRGAWMTGKRYGKTAFEAIACLKQEYAEKDLVIKGVIGNRDAS